ncbi:hypothetical protein [Sporosarcina koreensis]|uniref:Lipoprotein n=1 Tax=Sporosarcina koreensis TaxID=334735 RepID=A0ABW0TWQ7_9BACL
MRRWTSCISVFFILCCVLMAGCSKPEPVDENIKVIKTVLELNLNAPDEEVIRLLEEPYGSEEEEGFINKYNEYLEEKYGPYFTERGYEEFIMTAQASLFHITADRHGYQLTVKNIEVEQNEVTPTNYNFTVTLDYEKDKEMEEIELSGIAIVHEGKIAKITYHLNKDELKSLLHGEQD